MTLESKQMNDRNDFDFGVTLGTGSFGRVRFATHKEKKTHHAIKMLKKSAIVRFQQAVHIKTEKDILQEISLEPHPFIIKLAGAFQDKKYIYMILDCIIGGEFFTHLRYAGHFDDSASKFYAAHIVLIFEYLHARDIIYRDLKPENILMDADGYLKLTDFGFAKKVTSKTKTLCGTPEYLAPEILLEQEYGKEVDWWTLGILMYEMLTGQPPYMDESPVRIYQQILSGKVHFPRGYTRQARQLTRKLMTCDPKKRYGCLKGGANDVKDCKWFSELDWDLMLEKKLRPPKIPVVKDSSDTSNFESYPESDDEDADQTTSNDRFDLFQDL